METKEDKLDKLLVDMQELEDFLFALMPSLDEHKLKHGEDVLPYVKGLKLKIPEWLKGSAITWENDTADAPHTESKRNVESLVLVRPGRADALGLTIKCVKIKGWKFCLECGWLYCKVVVTKRF